MSKDLKPKGEVEVNKLELKKIGKQWRRYFGDD